MTDPRNDMLRRADERRRIAESLESQAQALEEAAADLDSDQDQGDDEPPAKKSIGRR